MLQLASIKRVIRAGNFSSVGSYPVFALMGDNETCHPSCLRDNWRDIVNAALTTKWASFEVLGVYANWEDPDMTCAACNERIESAYAEDDEDDDGGAV